MKRDARRLTYAVLALAPLLLIACGQNSPQSASTPASRPPATSGGTTFSGTVDVTSYGAKGDGATDNTNAFASAIAAAQSHGGGTLDVPAGTYVFNTPHTADSGSVAIVGSVPVTLQGAGRDSTTLMEESANKPLLEVHADGTTVEGLTLDTQTRGGGAAISVVANHTSFLHNRVLGGPNHFALYYVGPPGASAASPQYNVGNTVQDLELNDLVCNDGFSFSFQKNASISEVQHAGSRLALYIDDGVTVTDYHYTPGQQQCSARTGFWLTPPAQDITITNFVSSGEGGKISVISGAHAGRVATNVTIRGLTMTTPGNRLTIGDVSNLVLTGCQLDGGVIVVQAQRLAQGVITQCSYGQLVNSSAPGAQVNLGTG